MNRRAQTEDAGGLPVAMGIAGVEINLARGLEVDGFGYLGFVGGFEHGVEARCGFLFATEARGGFFHRDAQGEYVVLAPTDGCKPADTRPIYQC